MMISKENYEAWLFSHDGIQEEISVSESETMDDWVCFWLLR